MKNKRRGKKNKKINMVYVIIAILVLLVGAMAAAIIVTVNQNNSEPKLREDGAVIVGKGDTVFDFTIVANEDTKYKFEVHTDKKTVADALLELGLISGEQDKEGFRVTIVYDMIADLGTDGVYWAFYEGDDYAINSIDKTKIKDGGEYSLKIE